MVPKEIVHHATWLEFEHRLDKPFSSVEYFIVRYSSILMSIDLNKLEAQFLNYQLVDEEQIPEYVKASGRVDDLWAYLRNLTIPHSNAGEERLFSLINKNKTPSRDSLQQEGTLSSIMIVKTHISNPLQWVPTPEMLEKAKKQPPCTIRNIKNSNFECRGCDVVFYLNFGLGVIDYFMNFF